MGSATKSQPANLFQIVEDDGHTRIRPCGGPDEIGNCPLVAWGDVVPCAGHQLKPMTKNGEDVWRLLVPSKSDSCPIHAVQPRKHSRWVLAALIAGVGVVAGAGAATGMTLSIARGSSNATNASTSTKAAAGAAAQPAVAPTTVAVTVPGDYYSPAYLSIAEGTTVTWHNTDSDLHNVATAPGFAPATFDINLPPGSTESYTFTKPGLYVVYCKDHVGWDTTTGLPKAVQGTDVYPEAMAGVIAVSGPGAAIAASSQVTVPGDYYSPAYLTIKQGTTLTWNNTDADLHNVATAPGLAPAAFDINLPPGTTQSYTFTKPGLYVVYCRDHVSWDTKTGLPSPVTGTDVYPEAMAGAIFVTPS